MRLFYLPDRFIIRDMKTKKGAFPYLFKICFTQIEAIGFGGKLLADKIQFVKIVIVKHLKGDPEEIGPRRKF